MFQVYRVKLAGVLRSRLPDSVTLQLVRNGGTVVLYHNPSPAQLHEFTALVMETQ